MCRAIFSRYCGQRTMTNEGAKRNVPHLLQAQQASICLWSFVGNLLKHCPIWTSIPAYPAGNSWLGENAVELLALERFQYRPKTDSACCACSKYGTFLFAPLLVIVLWPQYREKIVLHMLRAIAVLRFRICALKSCPAPAALAAGAGHYFSLTAYNPTF